MSTATATSADEAHTGVAPLEPSTVFQLAKDLQLLPSDLRLKNLEWGLLLAVSGQHTVAQIGLNLGLGPSARDKIFRHLLALGLIVERPLERAEYLRARSLDGRDSPCTLAQFLSPGVTFAPPEPADGGRASDGLRVADTERLSEPSAAVEPPSSPLVTRAIPTRTRTAPLPAFEPLAPPPMSSPLRTPQAMATPTPSPRGPNSESSQPVATRHLSLRTLMRFIIDRAADLNAGQLDVYRVFIRIDSELLKRNGITTLRFADDRLIEDPTLIDTITDSLLHTLGLSCPPEAFVAPQ